MANEIYSKVNNRQAQIIRVQCTKITSNNLNLVMLLNLLQTETSPTVSSLYTHLKHMSVVRYQNSACGTKMVGHITIEVT